MMELLIQSFIIAGSAGYLSRCRASGAQGTSLLWSVQVAMCAFELALDAKLSCMKSGL